MATTIRHVAELAGVSIATVSRVINGSPSVSPQVLTSVRDAMSRLQYAPSDRRPGPKPASQRRRRATNIAFLVFGNAAGARTGSGAVGNSGTGGVQDLLYGVSAATAALDANLVFSHVPDPTKLPPVCEQQLDGLLLYGALPSPLVRQRLAHVPTVWLMASKTRPDFGDQVMPDAYRVGELAAEYLLSRGHRHLAFFNLDDEQFPLRIYGHSFLSTAASAIATTHRLTLPRNPSPLPLADRIDAAVNQFLSLSPRPTGLFVAEDRQLALLQPALQAKNIPIGPGQTEIVSCNNERPYLANLLPQPAEIDLRINQVGERGITQLLWRLEHPEVPQQIVATVEPKLLPPL